MLFWYILCEYTGYRFGLSQNENFNLCQIDNEIVRRFSNDFYGFITIEIKKTSCHRANPPPPPPTHARAASDEDDRLLLPNLPSTPPSPSHHRFRPSHSKLPFQQPCSFVSSHNFFNNAACLVASSIYAVFYRSCLSKKLNGVRASGPRKELRQLVSWPHVCILPTLFFMPISFVSNRAKAKRLMEERMRDVDIVLEVRDARAPLSCRCIIPHTIGSQIIFDYAGTLL
jgi:hypothetical protein